MIYRASPALTQGCLFKSVIVSVGWRNPYFVQNKVSNKPVCEFIMCPSWCLWLVVTSAGSQWICRPSINAPPPHPPRVCFIWPSLLLARVMLSTPLAAPTVPGSPAHLDPGPRVCFKRRACVCVCVCWAGGQSYMYGHILWTMKKMPCVPTWRGEFPGRISRS